MILCTNDRMRYIKGVKKVCSAIKLFSNNMLNFINDTDILYSGHT